MDYSKWKKLLIILMIINLLWIFYNRVFATELLIFTDCVSNDTDTVTINNKTCKLPSFVLTYRYIIITLFNNDWTIVFSNNELMYANTNNGRYHDTISTKNFLQNNSAGDNTLFYYFTFSGANIDRSDRTLANANAVYSSYGSAVTSPDFTNTNIYYISNFNVYDLAGNLLNNGETYKKPTFDNPDSEIQSLDFDNLFVDPQDYGIEDKLYLKILEVTSVVTDSQDVSQNIYYYNDLTFSLDKKSKYIKEFFDSGTYYYSVPYSALKLKKDKSYYFLLTSNGNQINQSQGEITENESIFDTILVDTQNLITTQDEILNSIINNNPSQNTDDSINNNLPRPGYNNQDTNVNIPGMNVEIPNDITENGFNAIFNIIYNTIYGATQPSPGSDHAENIKLTVPFVNYEFEIDYMLTYNLLSNYPTILNIIHTFYLFLVSYYIVNDIRKTIEKVKSGDIMTHTDTNIKADML